MAAFADVQTLHDYSDRERYREAVRIDGGGGGPSGSRGLTCCLRGLITPPLPLATVPFFCVLDSRATEPDAKSGRPQDTPDGHTRHTRHLPRCAKIVEQTGMVKAGASRAVTPTILRWVAIPGHRQPAWYRRYRRVAVRCPGGGADRGGVHRPR